MIHRELIVYLKSPTVGFLVKSSFKYDDCCKKCDVLVKAICSSSSWRRHLQRGPSLEWHIWWYDWKCDVELLQQTCSHVSAGLGSLPRLVCSWSHYASRWYWKLFHVFWLACYTESINQGDDICSSVPQVFLHLVWKNQWLSTRSSRALTHWCWRSSSSVASSRGNWSTGTSARKRYWTSQQNLSKPELLNSSNDR